MRVLLPMIAAISLPAGLTGDEVVRLEHDVEYLGLEVSEEAAPGGTISLDLYFRSPERPAAGVQVFLHLESNESACRMVADRPPTSWEDGVIHHHVEVTVPQSDACHPQELHVYTGMWNRRSGGRWRVLEPPALGNRIHAGSVDIVDGDASAARTVFQPRDMELRRWLGILRAWVDWLIPVLLALMLALVLRKVLGSRGPPPAPVEPGDRARKLVTGAVLVLLITSLLVALDFIKDDAYISYRYTHNLVTGKGLVFNTGDRLEGFTNFLWVLAMAPFEWLGMDLFQVTEVLGAVICVGLVLVMIKTSKLWSGTSEGLATHWAAAWIAASSSVALWSTSGMEQPLAMLLPVWSAWLLWDRPDGDTPDRAVASGVLMGLACMTRPEAHLIGFCVGLPLVFRTLRARRIDATTWRWFAGLFAITVPFHLFRWLYYGSLLPNTYFVKTGGGFAVMVKGLQKLREMLGFNATGALVVLAPLAFLSRRRTVEKVVAAAIAVGFMAHIVKVGVDEMRWHRLYLPALPFLVLLAGDGLANLVRVVARVLPVPRARTVSYAAGWAVVLVAVGSSFAFTYREKGGFNARGDLDGNFHPDMGKFITRHEQPGAVVAFQDMGSTPYYAPDIDFLDFIGLVDGTVAHARHDYGLHAFTATQNAHNQPAYNRDMREYFYKRAPEWTILTTYVSGAAMDRVAEAFDKNPGVGALGARIGYNSYQFGIWNQTFRDRYEHVRTWPKSRGYYLSLFRRKDLWQQTPREVVLDAEPAGLGGTKATFARGLALLGSEMEHQAIKKHEFFATTWWKLPGPLEGDVTFFIHVEKEGWRRPYDHTPGDWLWPAPRWEAGQVMENRVLVQLPWNMPTGEYDVYMGVYRRSTGQRLAVEGGDHDGQNRVHLGKLTIRPQWPFVDHLIEPTDIEDQRKYPERITPSGREPGQQFVDPWK